MQLFVALAMYHLIHNSVQMLSGLEDLLIVLATVVSALIGLYQIVTMSWKRHVRRAHEFYESITLFKQEFLNNWDRANSNEVEAQVLLDNIGLADLESLRDQNRLSDICPQAQEATRRFISRMNCIRQRVLSGTQTVESFNRYSRTQLGRALREAMIQAEAARKISLMKFVWIRIQSIAGTAY
jgi:hypothetical protein